MSAGSASARAFDDVATVYDRDFTETDLGRELRARVWERLESAFLPGEHVLELNCGTGEDASFLAARGVHVTATDGSTGMLEVARRKAARRGLDDRVRFRTLDLTKPALTLTLADSRRFDGAFSNFGGLNCVEDLGPLSRALGAWLRPGARVVLVAMGPLCLWEALQALARGAPRQAVRRLRKTPIARVGERTIHVIYRWPHEIARALGSDFTVSRVEALGLFLPPSLWSRSMEGRPRLMSTLRAAEWGFRSVWPFRHLGDHTILELERREP